MWEEGRSCGAMVVRITTFRERQGEVNLRRSIGGFVSFVLVRHGGSGVGIPMKCGKRGNEKNRKSEKAKKEKSGSVVH